MSLTSISTAILHGLGLPEMYVPWCNAVLAAVAVIAFVLTSVLVIILALRKVLGWLQVRLGPMRVGPWGLAQSAADALKLLVKEDVIPAKADRWVFTLAPIVVFVPAYMLYVVMPFGAGDSFIPKDLNIGILYILATTSVAVIGIIMAGWGSDNKYALLGALRSAAQLVSYEVPMLLAILGPVLVSGSLSMQDIVHHQAGSLLHWHIFAPIPLVGFLIYLISALAETNQVPFDLPEAESELVAGYNVEYSGMKFAFFFLAEFSNTFAVSAIAVTLFLGGWHSGIPGLPDAGWWSVLWFMLKSSALVFLFMWIRGTYPRVRIDQLMEFAWKYLIPAGVVYVMLVAYIVTVCGA